jgi:hypothetical protein
MFSDDIHVVLFDKVVNPDTFNDENIVVLLFIVIFPSLFILILSVATSVFIVVFRAENTKSPYSPAAVLVITHPISQQYFRVGKEQ